MMLDQTKKRTLFVIAAEQPKRKSRNLLTTESTTWTASQGIQALAQDAGLVRPRSWNCCRNIVDHCEHCAIEKSDGVYRERMGLQERDYYWEKDKETSGRKSRADLNCSQARIGNSCSPTETQLSRINIMQHYLETNLQGHFRAKSG